jgi:hypothetical protein
MTRNLPLARRRIMQAGRTLMTAFAAVLLTACTSGPGVATGTVHVDATLDDAPWAGPVNYALGDHASGTEVPAIYGGVPVGNYSLAYLSGGPEGASFVGSTPAGEQTVGAGGTARFTLHFRTVEVARSDVIVVAVIRHTGGDVSWLGPATYTLEGPETIEGSSVPHPYQGMPVGEYTLTYVSGGPPDASFLCVAPSPTQVLSTGDTVTFTLEFG